MPKPQRQQTGQQAPLPFIQQGQNPVNRLVVKSHSPFPVILAILTRTLMNCPMNFEVNHDQLPSSLKLMALPHNHRQFLVLEKRPT